jgi:hypothetical protein
MILKKYLIAEIEQILGDKIAEIHYFRFGLIQEEPKKMPKFVYAKGIYITH